MRKNGGLISVCKTGARIATRQYVINVDGYDWMDQDRNQNLATEIVKNEPDMAGMIGYVREYGSDYSITVLEGVEGVYADEQIVADWLTNMVDANRFYLQRIPFSQWCWAVRREIYTKV